jgi:hypothetical protein
VFWRRDLLDNTVSEMCFGGDIYFKDLIEGDIYRETLISSPHVPGSILTFPSI